MREQISVVLRHGVCGNLLQWQEETNTQDCDLGVKDDKLSFGLVYLRYPDR